MEASKNVNFMTIFNPIQNLRFFSECFQHDVYPYFLKNMGKLILSPILRMSRQIELKVINDIKSAVSLSYILKKCLIALQKET